MQATRIELLQQMPIFGAISADVLQFLLEPARSVFIPAGEFFFREKVGGELFSRRGVGESRERACRSDE